jgi:metallo-beta-lactamase class B
MKKHVLGFGLSFLVLASFAGAADAAARADKDCPKCAEWNQPQKPFRIFGNTYYVGTARLSSVLITSEFGHVLIDAGLPQTAPLIAANIEALGFKVTDIKAILNSHAHPDHAGGIAELQRLSGADVYVSRATSEVLRTGKLPLSDPLYDKGKTTIPVPAHVWVVSDGQLLGIGSIRLRATATPGHTPGGTSWGWDACETTDRCLHMAYVDSLSPVSAASFRFSNSTSYPNVLQDFASSFTSIEALPCDVLITPHPEMSDLFDRIARRPADKPEAIKDDTLCRKYVQTGRDKLAARLESEKQGAPPK